jgi:hypothetical protein
MHFSYSLPPLFKGKEKAVVRSGKRYEVKRGAKPGKEVAGIHRG